MQKKKMRVSTNHNNLPLSNELEGASFLFSGIFSFFVDTADAWKPESLCFCSKFYLARICISKSLQFSYPQKAYLIQSITKLCVWQILGKDDKGTESLRTKAGHRGLGRKQNWLNSLMATQSSHAVGICFLSWKQTTGYPNPSNNEKVVVSY